VVGFCGWVLRADEKVDYWAGADSMSNNPTTASSQAAAADSNGERAGNANGPGESPAASKPTRGELSSSQDEAFAHGISSLTSHAVQSRKGAERRKSFGEESVMSDATGFSSYTASDLTPEGRAVRAYLKQPLALRASVEAWEIDLGEIEVSGRIGEGSLGIVHKARWRNMDVAVKSMKGVGDQQSKEALQQEIEILSRNRHPNLVMFLGACTQVEPYKIVCEFMPSGSLVSYFMSKKLESGRGGKPYQPPRFQVLAWSMDLVRGLCFLHMSKPKIVHMNLKPCNLLLSSNLTLKVSDFGLSRTIKHTRSHIDVKAVQQDSSAQRFSAPELIRSKKSFDEKVDIYSVGILMWCASLSPMRREA